MLHSPDNHIGCIGEMLYIRKCITHQYIWYDYPIKK